MGIKVFMMGGRRCGKTSALASMFDQFVKGPANNFFTINNQTALEHDKKSPITGLQEDQDDLLSKKYELMDKLGKFNTSTFLVDSGPTYCEWTYTLRVSIPAHPRRKTTIDFIDCPGEFFQKGSYVPEIQQKMQECDVFVIVVDTPYLMEGGEGVAQAVNCVDSVQNFVSSIDNNGGQYAKMVMFVPIKCEKWIHEGRINEVVARIKKEYAVPIQTVSAYHRMNVCILPVETAGNIIFSELKDPYTITTGEGTEKCCKLTDKLVRLADGTGHAIADGDILNIDAQAVIPGTTMQRPHSWFHINPNADPTKLYAPHNCDQLPLHILSFMTKKMSVEGDGPIWAWIFGEISRREMETKMREIAQAHLIKEGVEGIVYLKKDI